MRSDEAYRACLDGKRVELQGKEAEIDNDGILCWKLSGTRVAIAPETLCDWELFKPEEPSEPETEEFPVTVNASGFPGFLEVSLISSGRWSLARVLTHRDFVRLNWVLPDGQKRRYPDAFSHGDVPTKLWWNSEKLDYLRYPDFDKGFTEPILPVSVTMLKERKLSGDMRKVWDKEAQNERGHDSRD